MSCTCKLVLKKGKGEVRESQFLSKRVHLGRIDEAQYTFFNDFFPDAFEMKQCSFCLEEKPEEIEVKKTKKKKTE
jgi:hypothetical protein